MRSAAMAAACEKALEPFPICDVVWMARGLALGTGIYSPRERVTDIGQVTAVTRPGGWGPVSYGSGARVNTLKSCETWVEIADATGSLLAMLETYDPRGSVARIRWGAPGLVSADWEPIFVGIVADWSADPPYTKLLLKTDDTVLRKPIPSAVLLRTEWGASYDSTIFGTHMPLVFGVHDAFLMTARGMVPAVNIRYDKDLGYWWLASLGNLVEVRRIYFDGVSQSSAGWSVLRGVYGGNLVTIISIAEGYQPDKGVVVSFDCEGPDDDGLTVGASITSPIRVRRAVLEEYTYRDAPLSAFRGDAAIVDDATWDAFQAWLVARGYDCGRRFGGDQNEESSAEVEQSFLDAHPWARTWWTPLGTIATGVIDPDDIDPDAAAWLELDKHHEHQGGERSLVPYEPGDRREVYTHLKTDYMWSSAEQKFMASYEAHDVAALPEKVALTIQNPWTQARPTLE